MAPPPSPPRAARRRGAFSFGRPAARGGHTMAELLVVLLVLGALLAVAVPRGARVLDRVVVWTVRQEAARLFALARGHALAAGRATAVTVDTAGARVVVHAGTDTLARGAWREAGVTLAATRDSMAYAPDGLGVGAANLRLVLRRGDAADTLSVSRLGRVRAGG